MSTIDGGGERPVMKVTVITATIDHLVIQHGGASEDGAGIINQGNLTANQLIIWENVSSWKGGGISNSGNLILNGSIVKDRS